MLLKKETIKIIIGCLKGTLLHPQWLSDRYHLSSRKLLKNITGGITIDIGSGNSNHSKLISSSAQVFRIDYPGTNCRYDRLPDIFADACNLPLASSSVDSVLLLEVIEHIADYQATLKEAYRALKHGGHLYISAPFIYPAHDVPYDFHRYTLYGLRNELNKAGFNIIIERQHGNTLVIALQMMNLALLEWTKKTWDISTLSGVVIGVSIYPFCLINNIISLPFIHLQANKAGVFGHFLVCEKK